MIEQYKKIGNNSNYINQIYIELDTLITSLADFSKNNVNSISSIIPTADDRSSNRLNCCQICRIM